MPATRRWKTSAVTTSLSCVPSTLNGQPATHFSSNRSNPSFSDRRGRSDAATATMPGTSIANAANKKITWVLVAVDQRPGADFPITSNWWSVQFQYKEGTSQSDHRRACLSLEVPGTVDERNGVGVAYWRDDYQAGRYGLKSWIFRVCKDFTVKDVMDTIIRAGLNSARAGNTPWETRRWIYAVILRLQNDGYIESGANAQVWAVLPYIYQSNGTLLSSSVAANY